MKTILVVRGQDDRGSSTLIRKDDGSFKIELTGNVPLRSALEGIGRLKEVILGVAGSQELRLPSPDLIVNLICDADANRRSLLEASSLVRLTGDKPVINHPELVMDTGRQAIAQTAADIEGLVAPHMVTVRPRRVKEIDELWRSGEIPADFLIRPLTGDAHGGKQLLRVASEADLGAVEQYGFDGQAFGITPFVDYRSEDGYYRKYRLIFINGEAYPRHLIISDNWMIHSNSRLTLMGNHEDLQAEEQRFLNHPRDVVGNGIWNALHQLSRRTKLDFVGMDFSLLPDGRALLFECNAAMNVLGAGAGGSFAYLTPFVEQIKTALTRMAGSRLAQ